MNELIDNIHERVALNTFLRKAEIVWISEQLLVVGTDIKNAGKHRTRLDASTCDVKVQLTDAYAHPMCTQVPKTQNSRPICDNNDTHIILPVVHHRIKVTHVVGTEVHSSWTPK